MMRSVSWCGLGVTGVGLAILAGGCAKNHLEFKGEADSGMKILGPRGKETVVEIHRLTMLTACNPVPFTLVGPNEDCEGIGGPYKGQVPDPTVPNSGTCVKFTVVNSEPWIDMSNGFGETYLTRRFLMPRSRRVAGGMIGGQPVAGYFSGGSVVSSDKANDYVFFFHIEVGIPQSPSMRVTLATDSTKFVDLQPGQFCVVTDNGVGAPQNISGTTDLKAIEILKAARQNAQQQGLPLPPNAP